MILFREFCKKMNKFYLLVLFCVTLRPLGGVHTGGNADLCGTDLCDVREGQEGATGRESRSLAPEGIYVPDPDSLRHRLIWRP